VKPADIFFAAINQLSTDTRARMPTEDAVKRTLRNQRKRKQPISPNTLDQLTIEGNLK